MTRIPTSISQLQTHSSSPKPQLETADIDKKNPLIKLATQLNNSDFRDRSNVLNEFKASLRSQSAQELKQTAEELDSLIEQVGSLPTTGKQPVDVNILDDLISIERLVYNEQLNRGVEKSLIQSQKGSAQVNQKLF